MLHYPCANKGWNLAGEQISVPPEPDGNPNGYTAGRERKGERWSLSAEASTVGLVSVAVLAEDHRLVGLK